MCDQNLKELFNISVKSNTSSNPAPRPGSQRSSTGGMNAPPRRDSGRGHGTQTISAVSRPRQTSQGMNASDMSMPSRGDAGRGRGSQAISQPRQTFGERTDDNNIVCACGDPALLLTVRKEGANQGLAVY